MGQPCLHAATEDACNISLRSHWIETRWTMHDLKKLEANIQMFLRANKRYVGKLVRCTVPISMFSGSLVVNQDNVLIELTDAEFCPVDTGQVFMYLCDHIMTRQREFVSDW